MADAIRAIVDEQMSVDDETSEFQLHRLLFSKGHYTFRIGQYCAADKRLVGHFCGSAYVACQNGARCIYIKAFGIVSAKREVVHIIKNTLRLNHYNA